jgi:hypothetical protein
MNEDPILEVNGVNFTLAECSPGTSSPLATPLSVGP